MSDVTVLAHAGGVPETLMVVVPVVLVVILLRVGAKKAPPEDGEDEQHPKS